MKTKTSAVSDKRKAYMKAYSKKYRAENKEKVAAYQIKWREENPDKTKAYVIKYRRDAGVKERVRLPIAEVRRRQNEYQKSRKKNDTLYRMRTNVSTAICNGLKETTGSKQGESVMKHLPYTISQLKEHLENQFEDWMSWDNHGSWHIHHIKPHSKLPYKSMNDTNFQICWALENLMPLEAKENMSLGNREKM